jgi:hypothetical protein
VVLNILEGILNSIISVIAVTWWIVLPLALAFAFWYFWLYYIYVSYLRSVKWVLLEVKIPAEIEKTPKAMEQIFAAVYGLYSFGFNFVQKYLEGRLKEDWISFELVGFAGGVHFYIRIPSVYRNLIESSIYSQYPDAEIHEAADYIDLFPRTLPNKVYDIWGTDYHLIRDHAYPIRTYEYFEAAQEEYRLDPISAVTEVMSKLKDDEAIFIQIFVSPTGPDAGDDWKKDGEAIRDKLVGRKKTEKRGLPAIIFEFFKNLVIAPVEHPTWMEEPKKEESAKMLLLTPGEREVVEGVEKKISKLGFRTNIRFLYIDKRDSFTRSNIAAVMSTFHQFNTQNMNGFRPNLDTMTIVRGNVKYFKNTRTWYKKRRLWESFRRMYWPRKTSILNTEELATIYHFPSLVVEAPLLRRLGTKKGEPPPGLPVE